MIVFSGTRVAIVALTAALGALAGCGGGDDSGGGSTGASQTPSASTSAPAPGAEKAQKGKLPMSMGEMFFRPKQVTVSPGKLRVTEKNAGQVLHEFILVRSSASPGSLPAPGGSVDEKKLRVIGEIPDVAPGESKAKTFNLKPGSYVYICNVPGHYSAGMNGALTVK
jgi:uncharacterized cupredoxin-like copper-binding protein